MDSRHFFNYSKIFHDIYYPDGYRFCPGVASHCYLFLHKKIDCATLFADLISSFDLKPTWPPPKVIPPDQEARYLLNHYISLKSLYIAEGGGDGSAHHVWSTSTAVYVRTMETLRSGGNVVGSYGRQSGRLVDALKAHPVAGLKGSVFGSQDPWAEAVLFFFSAAHVTTVEYYKTSSTIPNHTVMTPKTWAQSFIAGNLSEVDFAVSYSSLEHDGLGRYGDPLFPDADIQSMQRISCHVKPGGLLFLGVPTLINDELFYNAHRVYGPARYPLLTANWRPIDFFYEFKSRNGSQPCSSLWNDYSDLSLSWKDNPVVVLKNYRSLPC